MRYSERLTLRTALAVECYGALAGPLATLVDEVGLIGVTDLGRRSRAYVNGVLVYEGNDRWQSRDYRFLGTVGTYDALFLPLERGRNEVILAVSESFGGWATTGNLVPASGVKLDAAGSARGRSGAY